MKRTLIVVFVSLFEMVLSAQTNKALNFSFEAASTSSQNLAANWPPLWGGYSRVELLPPNNWDGSYALKLQNPGGSSPIQRGVSQRLILNQANPVPVLVTARIKGQSISSLSADRYGASLYTKVTFQNGTQNWCPMTSKTKNIGTFNWRYMGCNTATLPNGNLAIQEIEFGAIMGAVTGSAWFDDFHVAEYHPDLFRGAISIMFDDGFKEHYGAALPQLTSYGWKGVLAAVVNYLSSGDPQYMNLSELRAIRDAGWEIVSHSLNHADLATLSGVAMEDQLYWSRKFFLDNGFNVKSFALPFGSYSAFVLGLNNERGYYSSIRKVERGYNPMGAFPYDIKVQEMKSNTTLAEVNSWITETRSRKAWLVILLHKIRDSCPDAFCTTPIVFGNMLTAIQSSALPVVTYEEGLTSLNSPR